MQSHRRPLAIRFIGNRRRAFKEGKRIYAGLYAEGSNKLLSIYDEKSLNGLVRTIVVRTGVRTGETQLCIVTTRKEFPHKEEFIARMKKLPPSIVSITQNINREKTSLIFEDETIVLDGKETIHKRLGEFTFDLSSRPFFQLNPEQDVHLYNEIKKAVALTGKETVVDAYCGVGTIGL